MKKRLLALLLVLALGLSLAACSAPAVDSTGSTDSTGSQIEADLTQDLLTFAAGDFINKENLVTVNGEGIPTTLLTYWMAFSCSYFESYYSYYGLTVADYAESILADAVNMAAYYTLLSQKVAEYGCPLTDEQQEAINTEMDVEGEEHQYRIELYGLTHEDLMFIYSLSDYYDNLMAILVDEPTVEEVNAYAYQSKHILLALAKSVEDGVITLTTGDTVEYAGTVEEYNAEVKAKAEGLLEQLNACEDQESLLTLFDELMNEHSQDGRKEDGTLYSPDGYVSAKGEMVTEYETAALALGFGEISGLVESSYGYHIILRGELGEEDLATYTEELTYTEMDTLFSQWLEEAEVVESEDLESIDLAGFYERYVAWQEAYIAANDTGDDTSDK